MIKEYKNHITFPLPFLYILKCKNSGVAGQMKVRNFEAICIEVKSITYVQTIQTKLQNSVFGKYILKKTSGELSEVLFTKEVTNGLFSLGFESGLAVGSALLVIYGGA